MSYLEEARRLKPFIQKGVQNLSDGDALQAKTLYPKWEDLVALGQVESEEGYRFFYDGDLYRCTNADPEFQADWVPGQGTESLYVRIDETHAGTLEDPIPYEGNMELEQGKYYSQAGVTYLCTRSTGVPVYHALKELVGLYVEVSNV